jgi:hypothetical protein
VAADKFVEGRRCVTYAAGVRVGHAAGDGDIHGRQPGLPFLNEAHTFAQHLAARVVSTRLDQVFDSFLESLAEIDAAGHGGVLRLR